MGSPPRLGHSHGRRVGILLCSRVHQHQVGRGRCPGCCQLPMRAACAVRTAAAARKHAPAIVSHCAACRPCMLPRDTPAFCRFIGKSEPALVVTLYFHLSTFLLSLGPMAAGWPSRAVLLTWRELLLVAGITVTSFCSQLCLTRGFQLQSASRAAGLNFSQVRPAPAASGAVGRQPARLHRGAQW